MDVELDFVLSGRVEMHMTPLQLLLCCFLLGAHSTSPLSGLADSWTDRQDMEEAGALATLHFPSRALCSQTWMVADVSAW
jgi:hypothetical protein